MRPLSRLLLLAALAAPVTVAHADPLGDARAAAEAGDYARAAELYTPLGREGVTRAQYALGGLYADGKGVDRDLDMAARWYLRAAMQGFAPAQYRLGQLHAQGLGVMRDFVRARTWFRLAADQSYGLAHLALGDLYASGNGADLDYGEALRWYRSGAALGASGAALHLEALETRFEGLRRTVRVDLANLRRSPGTDALIVSRLKLGTVVIELSRNDDWIEVYRLDDDPVRGWIFADLLDEPVPPVVTINPLPEPVAPAVPLEPVEVREPVTTAETAPVVTPPVIVPPVAAPPPSGPVAEPAAAVAGPRTEAVVPPEPVTAEAVPAPTETPTVTTVEPAPVVSETERSAEELTDRIGAITEQTATLAARVRELIEKRDALATRERAAAEAQPAEPAMQDVIEALVGRIEQLEASQRVQADEMATMRAALALLRDELAAVREAPQPAAPAAPRYDAAQARMELVLAERDALKARLKAAEEALLRLQSGD